MKTGKKREITDLVSISYKITKICGIFHQERKVQLLTVEVDGIVPPIPLGLFAGSGTLTLAICKTHDTAQGSEKNNHCSLMTSQ